MEEARNTDAFLLLFKAAKEKSHTLQLSPPKLSRPRKIPLKLEDDERCNLDILERFCILYCDETITSLDTRNSITSCKNGTVVTRLRSSSYIISIYDVRLTLHRDIILDVI